MNPLYKAAVLASPGTIEIQERAVPTLSSAEALVRVHYAGICGTDLALYSGAYPASLPMVPGHEFAGEVLKVGDAYFSGWVGRRVTAEINNTCISWDLPKKCTACLADLPNHCQRRTVLGIVGSDGAFAELVKVPIRNLHAVPENIPFNEATFIEPLAAAIQTFELSPISPDETVVVLGVGRLGVLVCKVASLEGARVIAVGRSARNLALAGQFGASVTIDSSNSDAKAEVFALTGGLGADVVVEATGSPEGLGLAFELVRPRGAICLKSTPGGGSREFPLTKVVVDEIRIQGSRCGPFGKAIRLLASLDLKALISGVYPLEQAGAALEAAKSEFKALLRIAG